MGDSNGDGKAGLEPEPQPLNLSDSPLSAQLTSEYHRADDPGGGSDGKSKYKSLLMSDLKMDREARENGSKVRALTVLMGCVIWPGGSQSKKEMKMIVK